MSAHTPGPWVSGGGRLVRVFPHGSQSPICGVHRRGVHLGREVPAETEANANLIAAAPDLDAAASLAITALAFAQERYARDGDELAFAQTTQAKDALVAAQNKARGREPKMRDVTPPTSNVTTLPVIRVERY